MVLCQAPAGRRCFSLSFIHMHGYRARAARTASNRLEAGMLWTIFVILLVLWLLGMVSSYTFGGFIHILLVIALAIVLIRVIQGRRPV
jgi:hypothetical protein